MTQMARRPSYSYPSSKRAKYVPKVDLARLRRARRRTASSRATGAGRFIKGGVPPSQGRQELKFFDTSLAAEMVSDATAAANILCVNLIATGDSSTTRDGNRMLLRSLEIRGSLICNLDSGVTGQHIARIIVFVDTQVNGAIPAFADLLVTQSANSLKNVELSNRFTILSDESYPFGSFASPSALGIGPVTYAVHKYLRLNVTAAYSTAAATIAAITNGAVYIAFLGTGTIASTDFSDFAGTARVRFVDG